MKIAILTQPLGRNYGGIMQAWALQQVLKKMGHEPVTIDRQPDARGLAYRSARTVYRALRKALGKGKSPVFPEHVIPIVTKHTRDFIRANLTMSPMIDSTEKLRAHFIEEGYEAVIVGSDQTWRPIYSPNIYNFFLDFLQHETLKKVAYASSFGVDHWEFNKRQTLKCAALATKFDYVSVREESGVRLCAENLRVTAEHVLDPTLLLSSDAYIELLEQNNSTNKGRGGLYTYFLDQTEKKNKIVEIVAGRLGLHELKNQPSRGEQSWPRGSVHDYVMPPVTDWLSGFHNASFVVTDSFHGMVFSIIFRKPFIVVKNDLRGAARFESLLKQLSLEERLISDREDFPFKQKEDLYTEIKADKLDSLRSISLRSIYHNLASPHK